VNRLSADLAAIPHVIPDATDEIDFRAVVDRVSVRDQHSTILHQLGDRHKQLTYFHNGRCFRLTDVLTEALA
jgi:hypothetical protein